MWYWVGGGLGLVPLLNHQLLSVGACAEAEEWMNWLAQNLLLFHKLGACFGPGRLRGLWQVLDIAKV